MSVERYHQLIDDGAFTPNDHVELIHGMVIQKMSKNPPHIMTLKILFSLLTKLLADSILWHVSKEDPITLSDSEPEPDCAIIRGRFQDYPHGNPTPADTGLVIEVSDSTLGFDRNVKRIIYAENKIRHYWIVNIPEDKIEVYSEPFSTGERADYRYQTVYLAGESVPIVLDGEEIGRIHVSDILPPNL